MEQKRVPIMAVVGMREMETNELARHSRKLGNLGSSGVEDLFQEIGRNDGARRLLSKAD
jgi:threonyl-tRNA synthetase